MDGSNSDAQLTKCVRSTFARFASLVIGLVVATALLMTALLATLLHARRPSRLLTLATLTVSVALLVPITLILISISHVLIVFYIARHERYSSVC
jgi:hypothetical protein